MIEWKKYDESDHPELDKEYIVHSDLFEMKWISICTLEKWSDGKLYWIENKEQTSVGNVTYYAEINLPEE